jgi:hypothetical protein
VCTQLDLASDARQDLWNKVCWISSDFGLSISRRGACTYKELTQWWAVVGNDIAELTRSYLTGKGVMVIIPAV